MKIVILTGAGISAESGIQTFRDENGTWQNHDVQDVATAIAVKTNLHKVNSFYDARRRVLKQVEPNAAHLALAELEKHHDVTIITQNIDDLHERAGSKNIIHIHGELKKIRKIDTNQVLETSEDVGDDPSIRPHVCLFGESPFFLHETMKALYECDLFVAIGTSGNVSPACHYIDKINNVVKVPSIEINIRETAITSKFKRIIRGPATTAVTKLVEELVSK